jgi:methylated-DNA-protein-cysteine methyltransferase related protein
VSDLEQRVLDVLRALSPGEVVSYGDVADDAGYHGRARAVGHLLAVTREPVPWWRVVTSNGRLVPGHEPEQARRLRSEGVVVRSGRVVTAPFGRFSPAGRPPPPPRPPRPA